MSRYARTRTGRIGALSIVVLLLVVVGVIAYSQGWLRFAKQPGGMRVEVETTEARQGVEKALEKTGNALERAGESVRPNG